MTEKYVDVLITEATDINGSHKYEGNIYPLTEAQAQKVESEGKGQTTYVGPLETHKKTMETLSEQLFSKLTTIEEDPRLTDFAKKEDKEAAIKESEAIAQGIQEKYENELRILSEAAQEKFRNSVPATSLSPDEIKTKARLIMSETALASTFNDAVRVIRDQIEHAEPIVLRELQSHFYQVKSDLESKMSKSGDGYERIMQGGDLKKLYDSLKKKSLTPEQSELKKRADLFTALTQQRGDVREDFVRTTKIMRRQL
ncbi:hypothetical protein [Sporosarcina sp. D27]|uniref:hypothetical protein n=1 Tax=Sporosarcina sp. D27 TaxID=1382305 RepID=UPI00046F1106|nr:hypothetical protein [Sporosarcina sp. D27]